MRRVRTNGCMRRWATASFTAGRSSRTRSGRSRARRAGIGSRMRASTRRSAMALGHAIDFANAIGIENIEARQRALVTKFKSQLAALGVESLTPAAPAFYGAQSAFRIPHVSGPNLATYMLDKH